MVRRSATPRRLLILMLTNLRPVRPFSVARPRPFCKRSKCRASAGWADLLCSVDDLHVAMIDMLPRGGDSAGRRLRRPQRVVPIEAT